MAQDEWAWQQLSLHDQSAGTRLGLSFTRPKVATCCLASWTPTNETLGCITNTCLSANRLLFSPQTQQLRNNYFTATQTLLPNLYSEKHTLLLMQVDKSLLERAVSVLFEKWHLGHFCKRPYSWLPLLPEHPGWKIKWSKQCHISWPR